MKIQSRLFGFKNMAVVSVLALGLSACGTQGTQESKSTAGLASGPLLAGEILNIMHTVNNGEIKQAGLALQRSSDPYVLYLAQLLVQDHMAMNQRVAGLAVASGVKMEESVLSRNMQTQIDDVLEGGARLYGKDFDCTFLKKQADQHAMTLKTIHDQLLPSATTAEVKELLTSAAPRLEHHRKQALDYHIGLQCPAA